MYIMQNSQSLSLSDGLSFLGINVTEPFNSANTQTNTEKTKQLEIEYNKTLEEYDKLIDVITNGSTDYLQRVSDKNPYLNKYVSFVNGKVGYVTNRGVFKAMKKLPPQTPSVSLGIKWEESYLNTRLIPTKPTLYIGTDLVGGESIGNEGNSIFVDKMIQDTGSKYVGCYNDNKNMKFIGGEPAVVSAIVNGSFSKPAIKYNSYKKVNSVSYVPGWHFSDNTASLLNNSKDWGYPMPYPNGDQCVSLQRTGSISQIIKLDAGTNTISFIACGRNCCDRSNKSNTINVLLNNAVIYTFDAPINVWTTYKTTFNVLTSGNNTIKFQGTWTSSDRSTAIQNITLAESTSNIGSFTNDDCKQIAIEGGYRFYALQQVNSTTSKGYCAVSNDKIASTRGGTSMSVSGSIPLWASKTSGNANKAMLTGKGTLSVYDINGKVIYNTPSQKTSNYVGCYNDKRSRAMDAYDNGAQGYNNDRCQQVAIANNKLYYGLQNSKSGQTSQCFTSNDLSQVKKYGVASNCVKLSDGTTAGNAWSNAVYSLNETNNYYLILRDDGNMCVYLGENPDDRQRMIWSSNTTGKQQKSDPNRRAEKSTHGKNWISSGSSLAVGDFIGSNNGSIFLIMQGDGNLVLYTSTTSINCKQTSNGQYGGGIGANALYEMKQVGIPSNMGKLAYIDQNSQLHSYSSNNIENTNEYTQFKGFDSVGNDIAEKNVTLDTCQQICNDNKECVGYAFRTINSMCYPKNRIAKKSNQSGVDLYVRSKRPLRIPKEISSVVTKVDSITYNKYGKGEDTYYIASTLASNLQKQQLAQLRTKLDLLSKQISDATIKSIKTAKQANTTIQASQFRNDVPKNPVKSTNSNTMTSTTTITQKTKEGFKPINNLDNILDDSQINMTMHNYVFLSWSILALGTILISANVLRK